MLVSLVSFGTILEKLKNDSLRSTLPFARTVRASCVSKRVTLKGDVAELIDTKYGVSEQSGNARISDIDQNIRNSSKVFLVTSQPTHECLAFILRQYQ
jgi:hypothetical protein